MAHASGYGEWMGLADALEERPVGRLQYVVLGLIMLVCFADGFDSAAISVAAPLMTGAMGLTAPQLGASFSATLIGGMISLLVAGPAADRFGRRPVILIAAAWFALCTALTPLAWDGISLFVIRLMAGFGLGAVPSVGFTLVGEFAPRKFTSRMVTLSAGGYVVGTIAAGIVGAAILRALGWELLFYIGAALGLVSFLALYIWLPESPQFLVRHPSRRRELVALLDRVIPNLGQSVEFDPVLASLREKPVRGLRAVTLIFADGRAVGVLAFWTFTFMILLEQFFLVHWLPVLLASVGTPIEITSLASSALQSGALIGTFGLAMVLDASRRRYLVMMAAVAMGGLLMVLLGQFAQGGLLMLGIAILAGIGVVGPAIANPSLLVRFYPSEVRATGLTYNNAFGRIGAMLGPIIGGYLIHGGMEPSTLIAWMAMPAAIAMLALFVLDRVHREARPLSSIPEKS